MCRIEFIVFADANRNDLAGVDPPAQGLARDAEDAHGLCRGDVGLPLLQRGNNGAGGGLCFGSHGSKYFRQSRDPEYRDCFRTFFSMLRGEKPEK